MTTTTAPQRPKIAVARANNGQIRLHIGDMKGGHAVLKMPTDNADFALNICNSLREALGLPEMWAGLTPDEREKNMSRLRGEP